MARALHTAEDLTQQARIARIPVHDEAELRAQLLATVAAALDDALAEHPDGVGIVFNIFPTKGPTRNDAHYRAWRTAVLADTKGCARCGRSDRPLHAHHRKPWAQHPELRYDVANGEALCPDCHADEHGNPALRKITP
jgi:hypothetical protein